MSSSGNEANEMDKSSQPVAREVVRRSSDTPEDDGTPELKRRASTDMIVQALGSDFADKPVAVAPEGYRLDKSIESAFLLTSKTFLVESHDFDSPWYKTYFIGQDHWNVIAFDSDGSPQIISLRKEDEEVNPETNIWRALVRTKKGQERLFVEVKKNANVKKNVKEVVLALNPALSTKTIRTYYKEPGIVKSLENYEGRQLVKSYKFGVLYCAAGQTHEDDMFANVKGSKDFDEFLDFLGQRITLKGWKGYKAGLDVVNNSTGTESVFTTYKHFDVMFHVSTLLPYYPADKQQLERKRHLGNDIVLIVFKEGNQPYSLDAVKSEFNHTYFVIQKLAGKDGRTFYKLSVGRKDGVPDYEPPLPSPSIFEKDDYFREYLLCKIVNSERASYRAPGFKYKIERTRLNLLQDIEETYR